MGGDFKYRHRAHAGQVLGEIILEKRILDPIILALPRGGVPVAAEISSLLHIPFDVLIVRKIGAPFNPEYGIGAISEDLNPLMQAGEFIPVEHLDDDVLDIIADEKKELLRRTKLYRGERKLPQVKNRNVLVVDDGLATGITAAAAGRFLKQLGAKSVILGVPVGPSLYHEYVTKYVDEIICPLKPRHFSSVGEWYMEFGQVSDEEVIRYLHHLYHDQQMMNNF